MSKRSSKDAHLDGELEEVYHVPELDESGSSSAAGSSGSSTVKKKQCKTCNVHFHPSEDFRDHCSVPCQKAKKKTAPSQPGTRGKEKPCSTCGEIFKKTPGGYSKYCSDECKADATKTQKGKTEANRRKGGEDTSERGACIGCHKKPKLAGRNFCGPCKNLRRTPVDPSKFLNQTRVCGQNAQVTWECCFEELPLTKDYFENINGVFRQVCKNCINSKRTVGNAMNKDANIANVKELKSKLDSEPVHCITCENRLTTENCTGRIDNGTLRGECQPCINKRAKDEGYQQKSIARQKQRLGVEEFNARRAKNQRDFRAAHPSYCHDAYLVKRNDPVGSIKIYRSSAKSNGVFFDETAVDYLEKTVQEACHYCGTLDPERLNGLDRSDNTDGFTRENTVACCSLCNYMKGVMNLDTFATMVNAISSTTPHMIPCRSCDFSTYKYSAEHRDLTFEITRDDFEAITAQNCYLCNTSGPNGVDRIDSDRSVGYIVGNMEPCCALCNRMKNLFDYVLFTTQVDMIKSHWLTWFPIYKSNVKNFVN